MHRPRPRLVSLANDHRQAHEVAALAGWGGCINDNGQAVEAVLAADEHIAQTELALAYLTAHRLLLTDNLGADLWLLPVLRAYLYERQPAPARPAARRPPLPPPPATPPTPPSRLRWPSLPATAQ